MDDYLIIYLVVLISMVFTFTATPIYQATAQIVIEKENPNIMSIQEVMAIDATGTDYYQTQYQIIKSRTVVGKVIEKLNLENSEEFFSKRHDMISMIKAAVNWFSSIVVKKIKSFLNLGDHNNTNQASKHEPGESEAEENKRALIDALISCIHVEPIRNSRLVNVSVEATDPRLAAKMANEVVQAYIDRNLETKLKAVKDAVKWLDDKIKQERAKVRTAENALLEYKEQQGIITDFSSDAENITAEKLAKLNGQVIEAESLRVEAETRYHQALAVKNSPEMLDSIPEVLNNSLVQGIKKMEVDLYNRMSELSKKYGSKHPQMIAISSELASLRKRKMNEAKRVVESLRNKYKLALAKEKSFKSAFVKQKAESLDMNKKAIQYGVLQREAESSRHMYELLIKRFKEASLTEEMKTGNIRIIDNAQVPKSPIKPNKKRDVLLSMVLALAMGIGLSFLLDYLDNSIKSPEEIRERFGIPYLGPIPFFDTEKPKNLAVGDLVTVRAPKNTASEAFRGIRTGILFSSIDASPQVILVTSAIPSEGKTLFAVNLAVTMVQSGSRVLVIDCDMRRPRIHHVFFSSDNPQEKDKKKKELEKQELPRIGLSEFMMGDAELDEVIVTAEKKRPLKDGEREEDQINTKVSIDIIPCGGVPHNPSEILGSKKMGALIEELKERYDRIIIDSPPINAVSDSLVLSQLVDGVVLVIRAGKTHRHAIQTTLGRLYSVNANLLGAVLNGVEPRKDKYYYYPYYNYYYTKDGEKKQHSRRKRVQQTVY